MDKNTFLKWHATFVKKYGGYTPSDMSEWYDEVLENHRDIRNIIGTNHRTYECRKDLFLTLCVEPISFCEIGTFGFDEGCFTQGKWNCDVRYALAVHPHSFVLLWHDSPTIEVEHPTNVVGRALGFLTDNMQLFNTFNTKGNTAFGREDLNSVTIKGYATVAEDVLGWPSDSFKKYLV